MRKLPPHEIKRLLSGVSFTGGNAFVLFSYCFVCACVGLSLFVLLAKDSFDEAFDLTRTKVSSALMDAGRLYETDEDPLRADLELGHFKIPKIVNLVGPSDLALVQKAPLKKVKGQKRLGGKNYYEVRFIQAD
ncbi:MAG: hypothetical protein J6M93_05800 [Succinivibrio sp.]|nr:hypothetical protein [Succinivibrio sp.]